MSVLDAEYFNLVAHKESDQQSGLKKVSVWLSGNSSFNHLSEDQGPRQVISC